MPHHNFYSLQVMVHPFLQVQNMTGKLRFEVNDNRGCFIFPETWFGSLLDEFEELIDAYDADEISETSYINKLRRLARQENDFIDVHAHLAYVFLEQNAPRKALNAALKGLAIGNRLIPEGFSGRIIWIHPDNRPFLRALYAAIWQMHIYSVIRMPSCSLKNTGLQSRR